MERKSFLRLNILLVFLMALSLMLVFAACNSGEQEFHIHHYETEVTEPTCQSRGYTTYTCSCGHSYQDKFTDTVDHKYESGKCIYCDLSQLTITYKNTRKQKNTNPSYFTSDDSFLLKPLPDTDAWAFNYWTDERGRKITSVEKGTTESLVLTAQWKTNVSLDGVRFVNETYIYDGTEKTLLAQNIPDLCDATYENNSGINAGTYKAKVKFTVDGAACGTREAVLTIEKARYEFDGLEFIDETFTYDGTPKSLEVKNLPEGATVSYSGNGMTDAGSYTVLATVRYDDGNHEGEKTLEAVLTIEKASYDMSSVLFENKTVTYDGTPKSLEVKNLPSGITPLYSGKDFINAGTYPVEVSFITDERNYNPVSPLSAVLTVSKADYDLSGVTYSVSPSPFYNGQPHTLLAAGLPEGVSVIFDRDDCVNAGTYTLLAAFISNSTNYNDIPDREIEMTILKADYDLSGAVYSENTFTYDGNPNSLTVSSLPDGVTASYSLENAVNAGEYSVVVTFTGDTINHNVIAPVTKTLTILKADAPSSLEFESEVFIYDGSPKFIYAEGVPSYISVSYENNGKISSGEYIVTAHFAVDETNYNPVSDMTAVLTIEPYEYAADNIKFESAAFKYDGKPKSLYAVNIPEDIEVSYSASSLTEIGEYEITASFTADTAKYGIIEDKKAILTIGKGDIDMSCVIFEDMSVRYDGTRKNILIKNVPDGVQVSFDRTDLTDAGSYPITASFTVDTSKYNTVSPMSATLTILKGIYDLSGVVFENTSAVYDGKAHTVSVSSLPAGVSFSACASYIDAGIYGIEVSFEGDSLNYEAIPSKTVQLTILKAKLDMSGVVFNSLTVVYDGKVHSIMAENLPSGVSASYTDNTGTDAGEYRAVVSFIHSSNYIQASPKKATLTILKKEISAKIIGKTRVVYNKKPHKDYSAEFTGAADGDDLKEEFIYSGDMINTGSYVVRLKINNSNYQLNGSSSLSVVIYNEEYFGYKFPDTENILYKVGNANSINLSSLFFLLDGKEIDDSMVQAELTALSGNASGVYKSSEIWENGTIRFSGTGVVSVAVSVDGGGELVLCVEVVNAKNATNDNEVSGSVVFLNDIKFIEGGPKSYTAFTSAKIYGNGFTYDVTAVKNTNRSAVELYGCEMYNLKVVGEVYHEVSLMVNTPYNCSTVRTHRNSLIQGCYISNGRYALVAEDGTLELIDSVLDGGRQGNMDITYAHVKAHNLTTINQPRDNVCGLGIVFDNNSTEKASLSITGKLTQYNWIAKERDVHVFEDPQLKSVFDEVFRPKYASFQFSYNEDTYINMGIVSLNPGVGIDAVTGMPESYSAMNALLLGYHGFVMTCLNTEYVFTSPSMILPEVKLRNIPVKPVYKYSGPSLNADGNIEITCNKGETYEFDMNFIQAVKNGEEIRVIPSVKGTKYPSGKIIINAEESYSFEILFRVEDTEVYNPDGTKLSEPYIWEIAYMVEVRVLKDIPPPEFVFTDRDGNNYTAEITEIEGNTYIAPSGGDTSQDIPVTFVTVEGFRERTADRTIYHYFPCFTGVSIWDYSDDGRKKVVANSSAQSLPESICLVQSTGFTGTTTMGESKLVTVLKNNLMAVRGSGNASYDEVIAENSKECTVYMKFRYEANNGRTYYYYVVYHMAEGSDY